MSVVSVENGLNYVDPATGQVVTNVNGAGSVTAPAPGDTPAVLVTNLTSLQAVDMQGQSLWSTDLPIDALEVEVADGHAVASDFDGNLAVFTLTM